MFNFGKGILPLRTLKFNFIKGILGGVKTLSGPFVGASTFTLLQDWLSRFEYWRLVLGSMIILLVILFPQGLVGFARDKFGRLINVRGEDHA